MNTSDMTTEEFLQAVRQGEKDSQSKKHKQMKKNRKKRFTKRKRSNKDDQIDN